MRMTAPKVLVRDRKCEISRRNSSECRFGWSGNFSASQSPRISKVATFNSTAWPFACEGISSPTRERHAPVVIRFSVSSGNEFNVITACRLPRQDPSLMAMNWLFRKVRTQPWTSAGCPVIFVERRSLILERFIEFCGLQKTLFCGLLPSL